MNIRFRVSLLTARKSQSWDRVTEVSGAPKAGSSENPEGSRKPRALGT
jgi:hypothetical protein